MLFFRPLLVALVALTASVSLAHAQDGVGGQPASSFLLNQPQTSSTAVVSGDQYPYTVTYDPAVWDVYAGDPSEEVEYAFSKLDGGDAKMTVMFHKERVHYHELPQYLVNELTNSGLTGVEVQAFEMLEVNGKNFIFVHVTAEMGGDSLEAFVFHYLTDAGMLRFAFVTEGSEGSAHDADFEDLLGGVQIND